VITKREKFLMQEAMHAAPYYRDLDQWLNEVISDAGHTVEQHLDYDANHIPSPPEAINEKPAEKRSVLQAHKEGTVSLDEIRKAVKSVCAKRLRND